MGRGDKKITHRVLKVPAGYSNCWCWTLYRRRWQEQDRSAKVLNILMWMKMSHWVLELWVGAFLAIGWLSIHSDTNWQEQDRSVKMLNILMWMKMPHWVHELRVEPLLAIGWLSIRSYTTFTHHRVLTIANQSVKLAWDPWSLRCFLSLLVVCVWIAFADHLR